MQSTSPAEEWFAPCNAKLTVSEVTEQPSTRSWRPKTEVPIRIVVDGHERVEGIEPDLMLFDAIRTKRFDDIVVTIPVTWGTVNEKEMRKPGVDYLTIGHDPVLAKKKTWAIKRTQELYKKSRGQ